MLACVVGLAPIELNEVDVGLGERQPVIRRHCNTQPPSTGAKRIVVNPHLGGRNLEVNGSGCEVSAVNARVAKVHGENIYVQHQAWRHARHSFVHKVDCLAVTAWGWEW
jgi:hypothetical protein